MWGVKFCSLHRFFFMSLDISFLSNLPFNYIVLCSLRKGRGRERKKKTKQKKESFFKVQDIQDLDFTL